MLMRLLTAFGATLFTAGQTLQAIGIATEKYHLSLQIWALVVGSVGGFIGHFTAPVQTAFARDAEKDVKDQP